MKNAYFVIMAIPVIIGVLVVAYMVQEPQESDGITTTRLLSEASPILGSADARITIIEWGDYQCEFCHKFHQNTLGVIKEKYVNSGSVNPLYFADFVLNGLILSLHSLASTMCRRSRSHVQHHTGSRRI